MKKISWIILINSVFLSCYCQTWIKWIQTPKDESVIDNLAINDSTRLFSIIQGEVSSNPNYYSIYFNYSKIYYRTDSKLNFQDSIIINSMENYLLTSLHFIVSNDSEYQFWGTALDTITFDEQHCFLWLDKNFSISKFKILGLPDRDDAMTGFALNHDNHIVFFRSFLISGNLKNQYKYVFWEFDNEGNEINYISDTIQSTVFINLFDFIELDRYVITTPNSIIHFDYSYSPVNYYTLDIPNIIVFKTKRSNNHIVFLGDLFLEQSNEVTTDLGAIFIDPYGTIFLENIYGAYDTLDRVPQISFINDSTYYIGGTKNYTAFPEDSWMSVYKSNINGDIIFSKFFGGYGKYVLNQIESTNDGGCMVTGSFWDFNNYPDTLIQNDIVVIKTDANGNISNINNPDFPLKVSDILLYPNPGSNTLNISSYLNNLKFYLYDLYGNVVLFKEFDKKVQIKTSSRNNGSYLYSIFHEKKLIESGIWIKK